MRARAHARARVCVFCLLCVFEFSFSSNGRGGPFSFSFLVFCLSPTFVLPFRGLQALCPFVKKKQKLVTHEGK